MPAGILALSIFLLLCPLLVGIVLSAVANGCKMAFAPQNLMMSLQVGREKGRRTKDSQVHIYCNQGGTFSGTADPTNFQLCFIQSMSYDIHGYIIDKSKFNYISNPDFFFFFWILSWIPDLYIQLHPDAPQATNVLHFAIPNWILLWLTLVFHECSPFPVDILRQNP